MSSISCCFSSSSYNNKSLRQAILLLVGSLVACDNLQNNPSVSNLDQADDSVPVIQAPEDNLPIVDAIDPLLDTDEDGLTDADENTLYLTSPLLRDTDNDGLSDFEELLIYSTDPLRSNLGDLAPRGNPDGQINAGDLVVLSRIVFNQVTPSAIETVLSDINQDNERNVVDFMLLQRMVLGQGQP